MNLAVSRANMIYVHKPEQQLHAPAKSLKVHHVVNGFLLFDVSENGHADDSVYKGD